MTTKVACTVDGCDSMILPSTAAETGGACMGCVNKKKAEERRAHLAANRVDVDRFAGVTDPVEILQLIVDRPKYDPLKNYLPYPRRACELYEELRPGQLAEMFSFAVEALEIDTGIANDVAWALASFTEADLSVLQRAFLEYGEIYPPQLFRGAPPDVRDRLLEVAETHDRPYPALLALAWIGDDAVTEVFREWTVSPPNWAGELNSPPHECAKSAGWEICDGGRRELIFVPSYSLVPSVEPADSPVVVVEDQEGRCPWCQHQLVSMLTLDTNDPAFAEWRIELPTVTIAACHVCACYGTVFCELASDGSAQWSSHNSRPEYLPDDASDWGRMPTRKLVLDKRTRTAHFAVEWTSDAPMSKVGGIPAWIQYEELPTCPQCDGTMKFVGQICNEEIEDYSEGIYYMSLCTDCCIGATNYQQT